MNEPKICLTVCSQCFTGYISPPEEVMNTEAPVSVIPPQGLTTCKVRGRRPAMRLSQHQHTGGGQTQTKAPFLISWLYSCI